LQVRQHAEEVMKVVELDVLRDSLVGVPGQSGLSVEARKRLSIAVEQVSSTWCTACNMVAWALVRTATLLMMFIDRFNGPWQVANPAVIFMDEPTSGTHLHR
jgi:hypothetical protein